MSLQTYSITDPEVCYFTTRMLNSLYETEQKVLGMERHILGTLCTFWPRFHLTGVSGQ